MSLIKGVKEIVEGGGTRGEVKRAAIMNLVNYIYTLQLDTAPIKIGFGYVSDNNQCQFGQLVISESNGKVMRGIFKYIESCEAYQGIHYLVSLHNGEMIIDII